MKHVPDSAFVDGGAEIVNAFAGARRIGGVARRGVRAQAAAPVAA